MGTAPTRATAAPPRDAWVVAVERSGERQDVMAITGPLNAWIDQLPAKTLKKLEANLAPALFVVGLATVVGPDVVLEMRIRGQIAGGTAVAQQPTIAQSGGPQTAPESSTPKPEETELWQPVPKVVTPGADCNAPPSDAVILFDGKNLDQ